MTWTNIWNGIAAFFEACFRLIHGLKQIPNVFFWSAITIAFFYWLMQIRKQNKQAERDGTYP